MTETTDVNAQWHRLCEEFDARRDAHNQAFAVVNRKFVAMGNGNWEDGNPTEEEVTKSSEAWEALQDVQRRMQEFAKKHA